VPKIDFGQQTDKVYGIIGMRYFSPRKSKSKLFVYLVSPAGLIFTRNYLNIAIEQLREAVIKNNIFEVDRLLNECPVLVNEQDSIDRLTPLMLALKRDHLDITNRILTISDVELDIQTDEGWTALHFGCKYNRKDSVKRMLQLPQCSKYVVGIENIDGETALMVALRKGHEDCETLLVSFLRDLELSESEAFKNTRVSHHTLNVLKEAITKLEKESKIQEDYLDCMKTSNAKKLEILKQEQADEADELLMKHKKELTALKAAQDKKRKIAENSLAEILAKKQKLEQDYDNLQE